MDVVPDEIRVQGGDQSCDHACEERVEAPADLEHEQCRSRGHEDLGEPHDEPTAVERPVQGGEEPCVQGLGVRRRHPRQEAERSARHERLRKAVALLDEGFEDPLSLPGEHDEAGNHGDSRDEQQSLGAPHGDQARNTWQGMAGTPKPSAVVSCHVERILDDRVWRAYRTFVHDRPGGFAVASLVRPPDEERGEDAAVWLERVQELATTGPVGHHTHWTAPDHARPLGGAETGARVLREAAWLRREGVAASCFCGGGWYSDASVAEACASLGYVDCTPRTHRPPRLEDGGAWLELAVPTRIATGGGSVLAVPTTHSLGELVRLAFRPKPTPATVVHGYLHDTDLLDGRRRRFLVGAMRVLGRRRTVRDIETLAADVREKVDTVDWDSVVRGRVAGRPE